MDEAPYGTAYDLITMGRIGVDLYPLQTGVSLARVTSFGKFLGGSPSNVAVAAARLGRRTALITRTGRDPFGEYLRTELGEFGVDARWVTSVDGLPTPVTFCEVFPPDDFPLYFYRLPKAPDLEVREGELDLAAIRAARIFWVTGTGLCADPSRTATLAALRARSDSLNSSQDLAQGDAQRLDPRRSPCSISTGGPCSGTATPRDPTTARPCATPPSPWATSTSARWPPASGSRGPRPRRCWPAGVELAVVKQGPKGVLALHRDGTVAEVPPVPVDVVNGLGAGDAFGGALCHGLLAGWELERVMRYANAAGAIVASRLACSSAMPYPAEVERVLEGGRA